MFCRNCGNEMHDEAVVCVKCGVPAGKGNVYCPNCGKEVHPEAVICVACGVALVAPEAPVAPKSKKSKLAAGLLGLFLGTLGVHNFYLGYTGKAVAQLLITVLTCGIGAIATSIWSLVESIYILIGKTKDPQGLELSE